jgi:hypothetical protein
MNPNASRKRISDKPCARCITRKALVGYRFCPDCLTAVQREMRDSGYLTPTVVHRHLGNGRLSEN